MRALEVKESYLKFPKNPAVEGYSFESEYFKGVRYIVKDKHVIITDGHGNGTLSVELGNKLDNFISELMDIQDGYEG